MRLTLCSFAICLILAAVPAWAAQGETAIPAACALTDVGSGTVRSVTDGRSLILADGREVRLVGLDFGPRAAPGGEENSRPRAELMKLIGETVMLRHRQLQTDRYGRVVAHAFINRDGTEHWVQSDLVARGAARVSTQAGDAGCAAALLAQERAAREAKLGLWADPYYAIRRAEDPASVALEKGRFTLVEGQVVSVRENGATIYVNFGRRWSQDFAVTILKREDHSFAAAGIDLKKLEGRRIRVRGWVEGRGSPSIDAAHPEQIELLDMSEVGK